MCVETKCSPFHYLAVWNSESGLNPAAHNPNGDASGIFQAMPDTLRGLGFLGSPADFRQLSAKDQLPYAERYYRPYTGKLKNSAAVYVATFLPADLDLAVNPDAVLVQRDGRRGWAYSANAVFDVNKDYCIQVKELSSAIERNARTARFAQATAELERYLGLVSSAPALDAGLDLGTVLGVQRGLDALGFAPGPLDGIPGARTRAAILSFQRSFPGLVQDGIYGPKTRAALTSRLEALGVKVGA